MFPRSSILWSITINLDFALMVHLGHWTPAAMTPFQPVGVGKGKARMPSLDRRSDRWCPCVSVEGNCWCWVHPNENKSQCQTEAGKRDASKTLLCIKGGLHPQLLQGKICYPKRERKWHNCPKHNRTWDQLHKSGGIGCRSICSMKTQTFYQQRNV